MVDGCFYFVLFLIYVPLQQFASEVASPGFLDEYCGLGGVHGVPEV